MSSYDRGFLGFLAQRDAKKLTNEAETLQVYQILQHVSKKYTDNFGDDLWI